jgi:multiple sugar transport system substrate-binding protein
VVDRLGEETFSARALSLMTSEGTVIAVPSDGWGQLLIYRKDLLEQEGLPPPRTLEDVRRAARRLDRPGRAGIALATTPAPFTAETFEHVALATGCQLLDDAGAVSLTSRACVRAFTTYVELARGASTGPGQDVDSTRDDYFAGRAAMVFWSPFLLDAMAGLRDDAMPTCPQCREDPAFLARASGLVGPLEGAAGAPAQFGTISAWGITSDANMEGARQLVEYLMSDGYLRWLGLAPQGKFPVRTGDGAEPDRYVAAWARLPSGVARKAPLSRFYGAESIAAFGDGARTLQRWGFEQDGAALVGALRGPEPVARALAAAVAGTLTPAAAAEQAQAAVERLADKVAARGGG